MVDLSPAQTRTKYFSASTTYWSDKVSVSPKFVRYCTGSQCVSIGQWVVHDRPGWFCAVGGDMKVEQTIQRVSKGPGGHYVVGATRNVSAVAEFELLFHEI